MNNNLPILKFVLIVSWIASALACDSANQNTVNSTNLAVVATSPTPLPTRPPPSNPKPPKDICAYLSPDLRPGDYAVWTKDLYKCEAKKVELFPTGKGAVINYEIYGTADYVRRVVFRIGVSGTPEEKLKWEKYFVEKFGKLWQKAFAKPLPDEIKKQVEQDLGKPKNFVREFAAPVELTIKRDARESGDHTLNIEFYVDKDYADKN